MCETIETRFFRPWNATETESKTAEIERIQDSDNGSGIGLMKREEEEDNESVLSVSMCEESNGSSFSETETTANPKESMTVVRRRRRRSSESSIYASTSRSCSVNSGDTNEGSSSLDMLSNFVFNGRGTDLNGIRSTVADNATLIGQSAFTRPTDYSGLLCPAYPTVDYLHRIAAQQQQQRSGFNAMATADPSCLVSEANSLQSTHASFYYGLNGVQLNQRIYPSSVHEAVELIHRQDVAAKQMKKLRPKKFRCEHCDVAFSNNGQLKGHVRIHTGERPFKCDAEGCGKSFTRNEELTRHKRIHTGLRPHACLMCGKRFGRKDHLKKHTRTHDTKDPYRMSALGVFTLGHSLPTNVHGPLPPYVYPI